MDGFHESIGAVLHILFFAGFGGLYTAMSFWLSLYLETKTGLSSLLIFSCLIAPAITISAALLAKEWKKRAEALRKQQEFEWDVDKSLKGYLKLIKRDETEETE